MDVLRIGAKNDSVRTLQIILNQRGYKIDVNGVFDDKTEDAVIDFQNKAKLKADGIVGKMTWTALLNNEVEDFVSAINTTSYLVNEFSYYKEIFLKKNIVLHHTNGWTVVKGTKDKPSMNHVGWWNSRNTEEFTAKNGRVSTAFSIDYAGNIYQHFDPKYWAYHLGLGRSKNFLDKQSIGIELCNEGSMKKIGNKFFWYSGKVAIPYNRINDTPFYYEKGWRGYYYFAPYSKQQIDATVWLLKYLCREYNIKSNFIDNCEYNPEEIFSNKYEGIYNHANVRLDKEDLSPAFPFKDVAARLMD